MRRFRKVRHVPLPLLAVIMAAILFAELARCEREGAKETAAEAVIAVEVTVAVPHTEAAAVHRMAVEVEASKIPDTKLKSK